MEQGPLRLLPRASHPAVTHRARRRRRQAIAHWPEYYTPGIRRTSNWCLPLRSCIITSHVVGGGLQASPFCTPVGEPAARPAPGSLASCAGTSPHAAHPPPAGRAGCGSRVHTIPVAFATSTAATRSTDAVSCSSSSNYLRLCPPRPPHAWNRANTRRAARGPRSAGTQAGILTVVLKATRGDPQGQGPSARLD